MSYGCRDSAVHWDSARHTQDNPMKVQEPCLPDTRRVPCRLEDSLQVQEESHEHTGTVLCRHSESPMHVQGKWHAVQGRYIQVRGQSHADTGTGVQIKGGSHESTAQRRSQEQCDE